MELWIKDLKYFRADRMSCNSFKANTFRLFLYAAAYVMAHRIKTTAFAGTEVEDFTMDSFMKRIMLSAVFIVEKKTPAVKQKTAFATQRPLYTAYKPL